MVKLTPEQQAACVRGEPEVFEAFNGAWGRGGATKVTLASAGESSVLEALMKAWRNIAPKRLTQ